MDRYFNGLKIYDDRCIPSRVRTGTTDPFALELLELWENRHMCGRIFVVEDKEQALVGFLLLEDNCFSVYTIRGTWVSEAYRGHGIGAELMKILFEFVPKWSIIHVNITPGAEGFYTKYGFRLVGRRSDFGQILGVYAPQCTQERCEILAQRKVGEVYRPLKESLFQKLNKIFRHNLSFN